MKKDKFVQTVQFVCSAVFLAVSIVSVAGSAGRAVSTALPEAPAEPSEQPEETASAPQSTDEPPTEETQEGEPIVQVDLSLSDGSGDLLFKNETAYTFDVSAMIGSGYPIDPVGDEPSVLILHTHATECYTEEGQSCVTDTRSSDPEKNMIAVGAVIAEVLKENGVNAIHCTVMHDEDSYSEAYIRSKETVESYLEKYPSLKYVIDVHRDAISTGDGGMAKPVTVENGVSLAQLMLVVGTDEAGADHPGWKTNLCVAIRTQTALTERAESLVRPINLRSASFNQQLSPGFLLLEIGSCANTMEEAKASAQVFAEIFAELIKNP